MLLAAVAVVVNKINIVNIVKKISLSVCCRSCRSCRSCRPFRSCLSGRAAAPAALAAAAGRSGTFWKMLANSPSPATTSRSGTFSRKFLKCSRNLKYSRSRCRLGRRRDPEHLRFQRYFRNIQPKVG